MPELVFKADGSIVCNVNGVLFVLHNDGSISIGG